ncbi:bifunctional helix-turn-helix transcriptional regulator/GNAT family N-acetyltransferase [Pacificimonas sp. WHA3]|uniref:Bifunctional helix-turn-helix transcriptional regulator/GNAT family N-acetyltransferase n=1 Tax=Pacificimonas pallii TaxID=2827236 RepID=A0ABS6SFG3_9SPHN|nr:bifunctional helix-turn-helix transcriptional regulator/GNAT family N-acetyltransferase [Pacificimonas pallii]MBV7257076.1 bifunctional helix-turn-helix transcriptional regulator/GNAT family N-acetyltransferase [Pacificimonas pallii]
MPTTDLLRDNEYLFLGSRLKRLAERMQADVVRIAEAAGLPLQPSQYPVLAAIDRHGPQTVGTLSAALGLSQPAITRIVSKLVKMDVLKRERGADRRQVTVSLTADGEKMLEQSKLAVWPPIEQAVRVLLDDLPGAFLTDIRSIEDRLTEKSLELRSREIAFHGLSVRAYDAANARLFREINAEWIRDMYSLEQPDQDVLDDPDGKIIDPGGDILFAEAEGLGIIGTCALRKTGEDQYELTKMGVLQKARGRKAGEFLLKAAIERARDMGAQRLYLLTNKKSAAAIHLYEKFGFRHDTEIMEEFGKTYQRCDVAMLYCGDLAETADENS